ncbi:MAG: TRAP transporter large permease subunit [Alphaproteobacteria bacterium]|nr:TRAP transporter large permease subunit [Alphaproteobacteria bacterium]
MKSWATIFGRNDLPSAWSRDDLWSGRGLFPPLTHFGTGLNAIGTIWIISLMALICADVVARNFFNQPLPRVPEFVGYSIVAIVFLQLPNTLQLKKLIQADAFIGALMIARPTAGSFYNAVFHFSGLIVMALIAYGLIPDAWQSYESSEYFGQQGEITIPVWPFKAIMALCAVITAIEFLSQTIDYIRKAIFDEPDHPDARQNRPKGWFAIVSLCGLGLVGFAFLGPHLDALTIVLTLIFAMLILILAGMHIGVALILLSFIGAWLIREDFQIAVNLLKIASAGAIKDQLFGVVPLFVLMGMLINIGNIGRDTFDVCQWLLGRIAGGLGVATVVANTVFAAITGVSIASAVVFTKVSVPPMVEHGYTAKFSVGIVAGSSVLGMLIPPSLLLIVFGVLAEVSVGQLFTAAIAPGILLSVAFCGVIVFISNFMPEFAGRLKMPDASNDPLAWTRKPAHSETIWSAIAKMTPIVILIVAVLGGIYSGYFTPTEAGAVGAFLSLVIVCIKAAFIPGMLSWPKFWKVLIDTGHVSVSILFLIIAANMYTRMIALSGLPNELVGMITAADLGFYGIIIVYLLLVLVMGMVLDSVSIMLITVPLILPPLVAFNTDLIWFGIVTVVAVEIGLLTPPLGLTVYVVKAALGNTQIKLGEIFAGAFPFVIIMILVTAILVLFPELTEITR